MPGQFKITFSQVSLPGAKTGQNGRSPDLAKQVEELAAMNKDLKDKNDELILHLKPSDGW